MFKLMVSLLLLAMAVFIVMGILPFLIRDAKEHFQKGDNTTGVFALTCIACNVVAAFVMIMLIIIVLEG